MSQGKPVDFDALLEALGAANAEPPPMMKRLLEHVPVSFEAAAQSAALLAELEAWLEVLEKEKANTES